MAIVVGLVIVMAMVTVVVTDSDDNGDDDGDVDSGSSSVTEDIIRLVFLLHQSTPTPIFTTSSSFTTVLCYGVLYYSVLCCTVL